MGRVKVWGKEKCIDFSQIEKNAITSERFYFLIPLTY